MITVLTKVFKIFLSFLVYRLVEVEIVDLTQVIDVSFFLFQVAAVHHNLIFVLVCDVDKTSSAFSLWYS